MLPLRYEKHPFGGLLPDKKLCLAIYQNGVYYKSVHQKSTSLAFSL